MRCRAASVAPAEEPDIGAIAARIERYPALVESRSRVIELARSCAPHADLVRAVEDDPALTLAVLRFANAQRLRRGTVAAVTDALREMPAATLRAIAEATPAANRLEPDPLWGDVPDRLRIHAIDSSRIVLRLAALVEGDKLAPLGPDAVDELVTAAIVHDIGQLATDCDAAALEHAHLGAALAREWCFPERLAGLVERHHDAEDGPAALLRLADMLAYYSQGRPVDVVTIASLADHLGIERPTLSRLLYELPHALDATRRAIEPVPLSERELEVLTSLAHGFVPKEIAHRLGLAESTVRNHLHRIYMRVGAADRAQAVLIAREKGWI